MRVIDVTGNSDTAVVAVALAYGARHEGQIELKGDSAAAGQRIAAAIGAAQEYLMSRGATLAASARSSAKGLTGPPEDVFGPVRLMVSLSDDDQDDDRDGEAERRRLEEEVLAEIAAEAEIDEQIAEDFAERQDMASSDNQLMEKLINHTADKPILSGGDLDAAWDEADVGDETVGGTAPTPDQDRVDLLGEAVGLTYEDDEPLNTDAKLEWRDEHPWLLDPRSADPRFELGDSDLIDREDAGDEVQDRDDDSPAGNIWEPDVFEDLDYEVGDTDLVDREGETDDYPDDERNGDDLDPEELTDPEYDAGDTDLIDRERADE